MTPTQIRLYSYLDRISDSDYYHRFISKDGRYVYHMDKETLAITRSHRKGGARYWWSAAMKSRTKPITDVLTILMFPQIIGD